MTDLDTILDRPPSGPTEAALWLRQLSTISARAELHNTSRRLAALAAWAENIGKADLDLAALLAHDAPGPLPGPRPPATGARATPAGVLHAQIVDVLTRRGRAKLGDLVVALPNASRTALKRTLCQLVDTKHLVQEGRGKGTTYRPPTVPADVAAPPARPASHVPTEAEGPSCRICDCPFTAHDAVSGKCYGKTGSCVCREFRR